MRLHVHEWGPAEAPPLLCLHGITSHGIRFRRLAEERFGDRRVLAPDLRGHGLSEWEPPWDLDTHVADVVDTLDALDVARADVIGHSFGGRLGMELAASHPDRVGKLILFDPAVWVPPPVALARAEEKRADESWASVDDAVASRLAAYPKTPRAYLEEETPTQLREMEDGRWRYGYSRAAVIAAYGEMSKPPRLGAIHAPTLLIRAVGSEVVPVQLAEVCRETIPDCTLVEVQHGHELMWESLDETAIATRGFLEDLRP